MMVVVKLVVMVLPLLLMQDKQKWEESLYLDKVEQELMVVKEQDKEKAALAVVAVGTEVYQMAEVDLAI